MDRLERLVNLVIALRETRRPMTAREIRARVAGYGQAGHDAFRRMFERDKADLRALGVPVDTVAVAGEPDEAGYRIDPARYDLPDVSLEPSELAALALAVEATGLTDEAGAGLLKLGVDAGRPERGRPKGPAAVGVAVGSPHPAVVAEAVVTRTALRFAYRPADAPATTRTVDPYGLVHRRGRWYLVGRDHGREGRRTFRLDRIEGSPRTVGAAGAFDPPDGVGIDDVVPEAGTAPLTVEVVAAPEVAWQVARRARGGGRPVAVAEGVWTAFSVVVADPDDFVGWVLEYGAEVVVTRPSWLRAAVVERLAAWGGGA